MSHVPVHFSDLWQEFDRPHRLLDQNYALALTADQLGPTIFDPYTIVHERRYNPWYYYRPWAEFMRQAEDGGASTIKDDPAKFQVNLDVQQFKPGEICVKVVDKFVVVEGKHEERKDEHGTVSRQFLRKYMIPEQCEIDKVTSSLSSDGVLTITAPRKQEALPSNERIIKIEHTKQPAIKAEKSEPGAETEESKNANEECKIQK